MKITLLIILAFLSLSTSAKSLTVAEPLSTAASAKLSTKMPVAKKHGRHKGKKNSLLAECQSPAALPSVHCGRVPTAVFGPGGVLHVVFSQNGHVYLTKSKDKGVTFNAPVAVNRVPELIYDDGENRPKIVLGDNNKLFVSWTHKTPGRYSGDVRFARSLNGGKTFDMPTTVNSDKALIGHRFDAMTIDGQGRIYLVWIDKRDQQQAKENKQKFVGASLYYAVSQDSGNSFLPNQPLVEHSCECCRIAVDNDRDGDVVALWRHVFPGNIRDHAIAYIAPEPSGKKRAAKNEGLPLRASNDEWELEGCPHHGPDLSIDAQNTAHMAWFTQGKKHKGLMYGQFNFSNEKTQSIEVIDAAAGASRPQVHAIGERVYLMWKRFNGDEMELRIRASHDRGETWADSHVIATTMNGSDHPDWLESESRLFATWQTQSEGFKLILVKE